MDPLFLESVSPVANDPGIQLLPLMDTSEAEKLAAQKFESSESLQFVAHCFRAVRGELSSVLAARSGDRAWIDDAIASSAVPDSLGPLPGPLGQKRSSDGATPFGPCDKNFRTGQGRQQVAPLPEHLKGPHITLFGPADGEDMCATFMNSMDHKTVDEPSIVSQTVDCNSTVVPMWGADDEDSRTPFRTGILCSLQNITFCLEGSLPGLTSDTKRRSQPIRRIPGLAIPCHWLKVDGEVVPLHLLDLVLHIFHCWQMGARALSFYVPKLESEKECAYVKALISVAEDALPSTYVKGSVRILVVFETARAVFRINEMMDALYPYFAGASLGWHDYVAAAARLFRNDPAYRMPAKADTTIVFKHIRESHLLLANVVKARGGIAIGGMYGVLPVQTGQPISSDVKQVCVRGLIRDVLVQLGRGLDGIWVAHPEFVRIAMAVVLAYPDKSQLKAVIDALVTCPKTAETLFALSSTSQKDAGLDPESPSYARSLLAAELGGAQASIQNHSEEEVRYNTFQALQYITEWLRGDGCVALPAELPHPDGRTSVTVRVLDDLATTERSRWEVALEIVHGRVSLVDAIRIAREEMLFFRTGGKQSGALGTTRTAAIPWHYVWSPIAYRIWILLISPPNPRVTEFVTELMLPFSIAEIRASKNVWETVARSNPEKFSFAPRVKLIDSLFAACFSQAAVLEALEHGYISSALAPLDQKAALVSAKTLQLLDPLRFLDVNESDIVSSFDGRVQAALAVCSGLKNMLPSGRWLFAAQRSSVDGGGCFYRSGQQNFDAATDRVQIMSLSKPVASSFAIAYFADNAIPLSTPVAALLRRIGSAFELRSAPGCPPEWAEEVTVEMLMCHSSGLSQHYVHSFAGGVPPLETILKGCIADLGGEYKPVQVLRKPGTTFAYSGGAFLVLQYLLESLEKKPINDILAPYLLALGMQPAARMQDDGTGAMIPGTNDDGSVVERRAFPGVAAGCVCSPGDMLNFLRHLVAAYQPENLLTGSGPISHNVACRMLGTARREISFGAMEFMGTQVGTGLFIGECGENRIAVHQGANEGYRGLFVACYAGPAKGAILSLFSASDAGSIPMLAAVAREQLLGLGIFSQTQYDELLDAKFSSEGLSQEVIVNQGLKSLLFRAFVRTPLALPPRRSIAPHSNSAFDRLQGARILYVSNDTFANAPNLISSTEPDFDPQHFGAEGKTMDSWESVRHNPLDRDILDLELREPSRLIYADASTKWHDGNQVPAMSLEAKTSATSEWVQILPVSRLIGHGIHKFILEDKETLFRFVRVSIHPDGGLSRVRLYDETAPAEFKKTFPLEPTRFADVIPPIEKATSLYQDHAAASVTASEAMRLMRHAAANPAASAAEEINVIMGGKIAEVSNEHYGPASAILSPFAPRGMHDGMETRRARGENAMEFVTGELLVAMRRTRIEIDFTFFVNNNPVRMTIEACGTDGNWKTILENFDVKCFRSNVMSVPVPIGAGPLKRVRVKAFPCGGFNRLKCFASLGELREAIKECKL